MSSIFVDLQDAIVARLVQTPAVATKVAKNLLAPVVREQQQVVNVRLVGSSGERSAITDGFIDWTTLMAIDCQARAAADADPVAAVDPILLATFARLAGVGGDDVGLGVEDLLPDPALTWEVDEGQTPVATVTFSLRITHRTRAAELVAWP